tara:strand:- start:479 stop:946 length:468 start_codon:yes stop_codon:yes gene_type:complete
MRLIALFGVLFVLASCSDSDMEYDYALKCENLDNPYNADYVSLFHYIDLENETVRNITVVTDKGKSMNKQLIGLGENAFYEDLDYILPITNISNSKITFEDKSKFGEAKFELDVSNFEMIYKSVIYNEDGSIAPYHFYPERENPLTNKFKCISVR